MLFNNSAEYTQNLHSRVLDDLNDIKEKIDVTRCRCIGKTDNSGNLTIFTSKNNKKDLCTPEGKSLFLIRCHLSRHTVNKYPAIKELLYNFIHSALPTPVFILNIYFLVHEQTTQKFKDLLEHYKITAHADNHTNLNMSGFGDVILCRPLYAGNYVTKLNKTFNELEALQTLAGSELKNATFINIDTTQHTEDNTEESSITTTTTHKTQYQKKKHYGIYHVNTPTKELLQAEVDSTESNKQIDNTEISSRPESPRWLTKSYLKKKFASIISFTEQSSTQAIENTESQSKAVCSLKVEASDSMHNRRVTIVENKGEVSTILANITVDPHSTVEVYLQDI
ncbi:DUF3023 domain-containing protein [Ehrlichia ruminantium]|uniref:DUF3023 domain-containing protein n=1 Tax=Ehrlichia ruminantium TaxID=779 RepID=UPI001FD29B2E|nr:DUF3023 domain-containing protein [Ehrlichia ruminantium]